jgi:carbamate kinase
MRVVIALGGNAMTAPDGRARPDDQIAAIARAAGPIADVVATGAEVVLTHGNGPQVGNLLVKNELAASVVPPVPLDWCGAQTQGTIGAMLLNAVERSLSILEVARPVAALVSRTAVDPSDQRFVNPTKPIGRYLPHADARVLIEHGQVWQDRGERGWRRVVASPEPVEVLDAGAVEALLAAGFVVVAAGGGGIPTAPSPHGGWHGVEAVVDKDLTAALLAEEIAADVLVIATDVEHVTLHFGTPSQRPLSGVSVGQLREYQAAGHFADGSMGPKVEAACRFVEGGGERAVITSLDRIADAAAAVLAGGDHDVGTVVTAGHADALFPAEAS